MSITLKNVNFTYMPKTPFEHKALDNINLQIGEGEFVGIIGHTGCGKSTLIQVISGLIAPSDGEVLLDGEFRASNPESMYSSLTSILNGIAVTVRFTDPVLRITENTLIAVNAGFLKCFLICGGSGMNFRVVDCMGQTMTQGIVCGAAAEIAVPRGGMLKVTELISPDESF